MIGLTLINCATTVLVTAVLFDAVSASVPLAFVTAAILPAMSPDRCRSRLAGMGTRDSVLIILFAAYASAAQSLSVGLLYAFFFRWLLSLWLERPPATWECADEPFGLASAMPNRESARPSQLLEDGRPSKDSSQRREGEAARRSATERRWRGQQKRMIIPNPTDARQRKGQQSVNMAGATAAVTKASGTPAPPRRKGPR